MHLGNECSQTYFSRYGHLLCYKPHFLVFISETFESSENLEFSEMHVVGFQKWRACLLPGINKCPYVVPGGPP